MTKKILGKNLKRLFLSLLLMAGTFTLVACGGASSSSSPGGVPPPTGNGLMSVSLTDGPGDYDHVYITVKDVWFHTSDASGPNEAGWLKFPLATPVTVDLVALGNGAAAQSLWNNLTLPVGTYQQIRLFLEPTFKAGPPAGHTYFNEVVLNSATTPLPLRIPDAEHGIRLAGTFQVTDGGSNNLAIDFDAGNDVIEFRSGAEYVLKPRLAYFDLADVGAIVGNIDTTAAGTNSTSRFVFKAEQVNAAGTFHVVRRYSTLSDTTTGKFVIYPLPSGTYDLLLRGLGHDTVIIKGVPVTKGTTPTSNPTTVPMVTMPVGSDYLASGSITSPTGAWVNFYQTLQGAGEVPYEVRFRHFNPLNGQFSNFKLSNGPVHVAAYNSASISPVVTPTIESQGSYSAVADALRFDRSAPQPVSSTSSTVTFGTPLTVTAPWTAHTISGNVVLNPADLNKLDSGILFAIHGGMIVHAINIDTQMGAGGAYSVTNLPGGQPGAIYGVDAAGWSSSPLHPLRRGITAGAIADLRSGDATGIDMDMTVLL